MKSWYFNKEHRALINSRKIKVFVTFVHGDIHAPRATELQWRYSEDIGLMTAHVSVGHINCFFFCIKVINDTYHIEL